MTVSALSTELSIYSSFYHLFEPRFGLLFESGMLTEFARIISARHSTQGDRIFSLLAWSIETDYVLMNMVFLSMRRPWTI